MASILTELEKAADLRHFSKVANRALALSNPRALAGCAALVHGREPGGGYYRARFWSRVDEAVKAKANGDADGQIADILDEFGVSRREFNLRVRQGRMIARLEQRRTRDGAERLRELPSVIFDHAIKQRIDAEKYLAFALDMLSQEDGFTPARVNNAWGRVNGGRISPNIIKPSDWWAFGQPKWRVAEKGAIPGDIYANALYYYAPLEGVAVDSMAGSGTLKRVYGDRELWRGDLDFNLSIRMFDLHPRAKHVRAHDARKPLPLKADWVFIDPPYFKQSAGLYPGLLAHTTDFAEYADEMGKVIHATYQSLNDGGRFCLFCPKHRGGKGGTSKDIPEMLKQQAESCGFRWVDCAYVSRGRQQLGDAVIRNAQAKKFRRPLSDVCVLNVFER